MKVNRKFLRSAERLSLSAIAKDSAAQKIVSAVTAIGFVMQPVAALASTITRTDGGPNVSFNNGVADVFAGKVVGDVAINQFKEFQLDANNIPICTLAWTKTTTKQVIWSTLLIHVLISTVQSMRFRTKRLAVTFSSSAPTVWQWAKPV